MTFRPQRDVHEYYRLVTEIDIGGIAEELLAGRVTSRTTTELRCDCPNHASQSHTSLTIMLDKQGFYCFGCMAGGDVLQLVEFIQFGQVTSRQSGTMPETHRRARDFLAAKAGMLPLSGLCSPELAEELEQTRQRAARVREALTAIADYYHRRLMGNDEVLNWFRNQYGIGVEMISRLKIGYADNLELKDLQGTVYPSLFEELSTGGKFTTQELLQTGAISSPFPDARKPFFDRRIVFPYWSRGQVVYLIGRRTPWSSTEKWESPKYKKLPVRSEKNNHIADCVSNNVLYNEDILLSRPDRVIITEGVTDCISLMEKGFAAVSAVTIRIKESDWIRILPKLKGTKTLFICQDNEVSQAGLNGSLCIGHSSTDTGVTARIAILPLAKKQQQARRELRESFGIAGSDSFQKVAECLKGRSPEEIEHAEALLANAKIDVNEFFAAGASAAEFEQILNAAKTALEFAISQIPIDTPEADLSPMLDPILTKIRQLDPIEQDRHLKMVQQRVGKDRASLKALRQQLKVVSIDGPRGGKVLLTSGSRGHLAVAVGNQSRSWRDDLILNVGGTVKAIIANAIHALRHAPEWKGVLAYNEFSYSTMMLQPAPWPTSDKIAPREWTDQDDLRTTEWLQQQGIYVSNEVTGKAVEVVARDYKFHPVQSYLANLQWDGIPRLHSWLSKYLGAEDCPYTAAVGSRWMISAVARVMDPGCKADCCMILEGPQGIKKSTALRTLAGEWFTDEIAELGSKDAALQTRGVWIIEIGELDSMTRSDVGKVKAFMSRQVDRFRPPYGRRPIQSPRQCVFAGSVNHNDYLTDETGGRRFWPVKCKDGIIDINGLADARDQLWAEAVCAYSAGVPWWLDSPDLNRLAAEQQADRFGGDAWDELIVSWVQGRESVSISEILESCLLKPKERWTDADKKRVARCLKANGWERINVGKRGGRQWKYRRKDSLPLG